MTDHRAPGHWFGAWRKASRRVRRAAQRKHKNKRQKNNERPILLEPFEPRILLSSATELDNDPFVAASHQSLATSDLVTYLNDGFAAIESLVPQWASLFDLDEWSPDFAGFGLSDFDLAVVTEQLDTLFGITGTGGALDGFALPAIDPLSAPDGLIDTFSELVDALEALSNITIVGVEGGAEGYPATDPGTDIFDLSLDLNFSDLLGSAQFNDATALLEGLASAGDLDGLINWLGGLAVNFDFGIDGSGFFLKDTSALKLAIAAGDSVAVSGAVDLGGGAGFSATGTAGGTIEVSLTPGTIGQRFTIADLFSAPDTLVDPTTYLTPVASGELDLDLEVTLPAMSLGWSGAFTFSSLDKSVTSEVTASLSGELTLPQFSELGQAGPAPLVFTGTYDPINNQWDLGLQTTPAAAYAFGGFELEDLSASISISPSSFEGTLGGTIAVSFAGAAPTDVTVAAAFDTQALHLDAFAEAGTTIIGDPAILEVVDPRLIVEIESDFVAGTVEGQTRFTALSATLFPRAASSDPDAIEVLPVPA